MHVKKMNDTLLATKFTPTEGDERLWEQKHRMTFIQISLFYIEDVESHDHNPKSKVSCANFLLEMKFQE